MLNSPLKTIIAQLIDSLANKKKKKNIHDESFEQSCLNLFTLFVIFYPSNNTAEGEIKGSCLNILLFLQENLQHILNKWNNSKINGTPKGVYLPLSKLHSILSVANVGSKWTSKPLWRYHLFCC